MRHATLAALAVALAAPVAEADPTRPQSALFYDFEATGAGGSTAAGLVRAAPDWTARIGIGALATGAAVGDGAETWGLGGELLYRASAHVALELDGAYARDWQGAVPRTDLPFDAGLRLHVGRPDWPVSPYLALAAGLDFAGETLGTAVDEALLLEGQAGAGIEIRFGEHLALSLDARAVGRLRAGSPSSQVLAVRDVDGKPVTPLGDTIGAQARVAVEVYF